MLGSGTARSGHPPTPPRHMGTQQTARGKAQPSGLVSRPRSRAGSGGEWVERPGTVLGHHSQRGSPDLTQGPPLRSLQNKGWVGGVSTRSRGGMGHSAMHGEEDEDVDDEYLGEVRGRRGRRGRGCGGVAGGGETEEGEKLGEVRGWRGGS